MVPTYPTYLCKVYIKFIYIYITPCPMKTLPPAVCGGGEGVGLDPAVYILYVCM